MEWSLNKEVDRVLKLRETYQKASGSEPVKNSPDWDLLFATTQIISLSAGVILMQQASLLLVAWALFVLKILFDSKERVLFSLSNHGSGITT